MFTVNEKCVSIFIYIYIYISYNIFFPHAQPIPWWWVPHPSGSRLRQAKRLHWLLHDVAETVDNIFYDVYYTAGITEASSHILHTWVAAVLFQASVNFFLPEAPGHLVAVGPKRAGRMSVCWPMVKVTREGVYLTCQT